MLKLIENIFTLMSVIVIWVITADYLLTPNAKMISFILCLFSIIFPALWISNWVKAQKKGTNSLSFWRNPK
ncbi:hypothetical protein TEGAF0_15660 [Sediminibacterium sp. TEGAF015]|nr:hypothetical protein TEGAF0_15660 [Sediminibacterium sp. TEGAF015]